MASFELLYVFCERLLEAQVSHMIEGNFRPGSATEKFRELKARYDFEPFEIHCLAETGVIIERYQARDANGERHPIHRDSMRVEDLEQALHAGLHGPLELGGTVYRLDTTDFGALDYNSLFAALEEVLGRG
jgi:hypothetical protein